MSSRIWPSPACARGGSRRSMANLDLGLYALFLSNACLQLGPGIARGGRSPRTACQSRHICALASARALTLAEDPPAGAGRAQKSPNGCSDRSAVLRCGSDTAMASPPAAAPPPLPLAPEVRRLVEELRLSPHPEGGFYRETFRDREVDGRALRCAPAGLGGRAAQGFVLPRRPACCPRPRPLPPQHCHLLPAPRGRQVQATPP